MPPPDRAGPRVPVTVVPSPPWLARRLVLAGMRPINNVVDASNYVMLELGQPTHPYDLDRLGAPGPARPPGRARARWCGPSTGSTGTLGVPGRGLGETGEDCVICDAAGTRSGSAGSSAAARRRSPARPPGCCSRPPTSSRWRSPGPPSASPCGPRPRPASSGAPTPSGSTGRPTASASWSPELAPGTVVAAGHPRRAGRARRPPTRITLSTDRVNALLGTALSTRRGRRAPPPARVRLRARRATTRSRCTCPPTGPTSGPAPRDVADLSEEVARIYGYSRIERTPTDLDRARAGSPPTSGTGGGSARCSSGSARSRRGRRRSSTRARTARVGVTGPPVGSPIRWPRTRRRSGAPSWRGCSGALAWNLDRRQGAIRLFEVGVVFAPPDPAQADARCGPGPGAPSRRPSRSSASSCRRSSPPTATTPARRWRPCWRLADDLRLVDLRLRAPAGRVTAAPGSTRPVRPRSGPVPDGRGRGHGRRGRPGGGLRLRGRRAAHRLAGARPRSGARPAVVGRASDGPSRSAGTRRPTSISRSASSDDVPADLVTDVLSVAGGELLGVGYPLRRLSGPGRRARPAEPGVPPPVLCARPDADRPRGRRAAVAMCRSGRAGARGGTSLRRGGRAGGSRRHGEATANRGRGQRCGPAARRGARRRARGARSGLRPRALPHPPQRASRHRPRSSDRR